MGNSRSFTSKFVANKEAFERILRRAKCTSMPRRKAAMERAAVLPNSQPQGVRAARRAMSERGE